MGETPGWVDPAEPPAAEPPAAVPPTAVPPPAVPPPATPPPAWQYFTSPAPAGSAAPPPTASSWGWQQPPPPAPGHRYGDYGPPSGQHGQPGPPQYVPNPQFGPPQQYVPNPQFGPPPHYVPNPQFGPPPQYGPPGQNVPPPQYGQYGQYPQYPQDPQYGGTQYGQWGGYQQEYKPGIVPLRPLSVGEVLDGSFSTIRKHPRIVFGFAAVLAVAAALIRLGVGLALNNVPGTFGSTSFSTNSTDSSGDNLHSTGLSATGYLVSLVVNALCVALLAGIVTGVVGKAVIGQPADGREILRSIRKRWFGLLMVSILAEILPFTPFVLVILGILLGLVSPGLGVAGGVLGGIAAVVLGGLLWGRLAVAVPIFILERRGPGASIARSWRLVRGAFWRTWGLRALVTIIVSIASSVLSLPVYFVIFASALNGHTPSTASLVLLVIASAGVWMLTQPLIAAALTLIYVDRRMRAEGLDLQLTQAARAAATPSAMSTPGGFPGAAHVGFPA